MDSLRPCGSIALIAAFVAWGASGGRNLNITFSGETDFFCGPTLRRLDSSEHQCIVSEEPRPVVALGGHHPSVVQIRLSQGRAEVEWSPMLTKYLQESMTNSGTWSVSSARWRPNSSVTSSAFTCSSALPRATWGSTSPLDLLEHHQLNPLDTKT